MDMQLREKALGILRRYWSFRDFRLGQLEIVEAIAKGQDVLAVLATGGGKSICYQVPGLCREGLVVVVTPLISLMQDQVQRLQRQNISAAAINSTVEKAEKQAVIESIYAGKLKFLYVSPEQLGANWLTELLSSIEIALIAVDEAHCISVWGQDFRPSYMKIATNISKLGKRYFPIAAFTATATAAVQKEIITSLCLQNSQHFVNSFCRNNLGLHVVKSPDSKQWQQTILKSLQEGPALIYASSRVATVELATEFEQLGVNTAYYHAGLEPARRAEIQSQFLADKLQLIVATNAFGMGVDKPNIRNVFHDAIPDSIENYFQEVGRAGRDGNQANAFLRLSWKGINTRTRMLTDRNLNGQEANKIYNYLRSLEKLELSIGDCLKSLQTLNSTKLLYALELFQRVGICEFELDKNNEKIMFTRINKEIIFLGRHLNFRRQANLLKLGQQRLKSLIDYCLSEDCRMRKLVKYFGEEAAECGNCDNCYFHASVN